MAKNGSFSNDALKKRQKEERKKKKEARRQTRAARIAENAERGVSTR